MEEIEVPLEHAQEHIHHAASHSGERWVTISALFSAVLAVLAALASLNAGQHVNEALIHQIKASDQWGYYQAKGIKLMLAETRMDVAGESDKPAIAQKIAKYKDDQTEIKKKGDEETKLSEESLEKHEMFARAVTLFQIAIAMVAICLLVKKPWMLSISGAFSVVGIGFLIAGF